MKFTKTKVGISKEILKRRLGGELFVPVTVNLEGAEVVKAGTPIDASGKVTTDTPVGILLYDVTVDEPVGSLVKAFACVNEANCPSGVITSTIKSALPLIVFE